MDWPALFFVAPVCFFLLLAACSDRRDIGRKDSQAPQFVLAAPDGKRVAMEDFRGKVVVLDFFATWCEPCRISARSLQSLHEKYRGRGVAVLGISLDTGEKASADVKAFMRELGLTYKVAIDDGKTAGRYGVFAMPTTFVIDRKGSIRGSHMGIAHGYSEKITAEIEAALN